jgi:glycolate oxidase
VITTSILQELAAIAGTTYVLTDDEARTTYGKDETEDLVFLPDVVVRPGTVDEVSAVLALATRERIPVTPRGGGTGLSGGALPLYGGIVLSLDRFNRILSLDRENLQAVVEPGVITQVLQEEVEHLGLYYPPDPASRGSCHLGGNLAECAGGPHAVKYGVTRDYVLGLEAVLPGGEVFTTGARVLKNVSGYNLTQLLLGSEGTLAVITKVTLRLIPLPKFRKVLLVAFPGLETASRAVAAIFQHGVTPAALEFLERDAVTVAVEHLGRQFPNSEAPAQLFIEVDGNHEESLSADIETIAAVVQEHQAIDVLIAEDRARVAEVWALRRGIGEAVKSLCPYKEEDTVVPRARLPELLAGVKAICSRYNIRNICYGHAGDGNVHVNLLKGALHDAVWEATSEQAIHDIFELVVSLGGTISAEHGIGLTQKKYLPLALSPVELTLMRKVKNLFDPLNILNPGKIFPDHERDESGPHLRRP